MTQDAQATSQPPRTLRDAYRDLPIAGKLGVMVGTFAVGFLVFAWLLFDTLATIRVNSPMSLELQKTKDVIGDFAPPAMNLLELRNADLEVLDLMGRGDPRPILERARNYRTEFEKGHENWDTRLDGRGKELASVLTYRPAMAYFEVREREFVPAVLAGDKDRARRVYEGQMGKDFAEHRAAVEELTAWAGVEIKAIQGWADTLMTSRVRTAALVGIFVLVTVLAVSFLVSASITRPLGRAVCVLDTAAEGDLTARMTVDSRDEIGRLAVALERCLRRMSSTLCAVGKGVLNLTATSEQMEGLSTQLGTTADETTNRADLVAAASHEVSVSAGLVACSVEEIGATLGEISRNASSAVRVANDAVAAASEVQSSLAELETRGKEIGEVVGVIISLAEQTNLLALNATIEAARAGSAGHGFAVVAGEVKELSRQTARSTDEIRNKIQAIQLATQNSVKSISRILQITHEIHEFQTTIAGAVEEQNATTSEMARTFEEVSHASEDIAKNISSVANAARQTSEGVGQAREAAAELAHLAMSLQTHVERFRFDDADDAEPVGHSRQSPAAASTRRPATPRPGDRPTPAVRSGSEPNVAVEPSRRRPAFEPPKIPGPPAAHFGGDRSPGRRSNGLAK
jgi:methyl-accepting chemotaxis protein